MIVTFYFVSHTETHYLSGEWTRHDLWNRAKEIGAEAWE